MTDSMAVLIDEVVMQNLALYGRIRNSDPYLQHLVKTSDHPVMRFRRRWMRQEAIRQLRAARQNQTKLNETREPSRRGGDIRRLAVIDPYLKEEMAYRHGTQWNDPGFIKSVREEAPKLFA